MKARLYNSKSTEICSLALERFGESSQIYMLFEEMSELQNAICKYSRGRCSVQDIITEIADVMIMCRQMAIFFGEDDVENEILHKINRLGKRLVEPSDNSV